MTGQGASPKVATTAKKQERVIVRFAGDSGDGMQLVGARFTAATALFGNDLSTLPDFPAEIRAPAGTPHGVSAFQIHFASRDILTPGDYPNTLVAMNPAALAAHLGGARVGRDADRQRGRLHESQPRQGRLRGEPARRRHARRLPGLPGPDDDADDPRRRGHRGAQTGGSAADQERLRPRPDLVDVRAADRVDDLLAGDEIRQEAGGPDANIAAFKAGYNFGETTEIAATPIEIEPAPLDAGRVPQHQRRQRDGDGPDRGQRPQRPADVLRQLPDHARLGAAAPPRPPRPLRRPHGPGRGRDRRRQHGARRLLRRQARGDRDQRPRDGPEGGDDRAGGDARAADGDRRRPARRSLDRDADQDRAGATC